MKKSDVLLLAVGLAFLGFTFPSSAAPKEITAFKLIEEGNRYVGDQAKDRVVQIRSQKSVGDLHPNIWYVVYYDPTARLKATEVKFGAGKMLDVKRPMRLLEPITGGDTPLDREKLKVDSDEALKIATSEPLLENIKVTASELKLERGGPDKVPVWKVRLWAAKLRASRRDADIGEVILSAEDGKIIKLNLHIDRVH